MNDRLTLWGRKGTEVWNTFWHAQGKTFNLGVFRILFAACLFKEVGTTIQNSPFAIVGDFHLPYLPWIPLLTEETYAWIHHLQYPFILLLGLGLFTRISLSTLLLLQGYVFFADRLNFRNHPYFFLLVLFILIFSPADDALSLKSLIRAWRASRPVFSTFLGSKKPLTFQRLIQVQVCMVYFYAGLYKLNAGYLSGHVLGFFLLPEMYRGGLPENVVRNIPDPWVAMLVNFLFTPEVLKTLSVLTVALELTLPLALWFRKTRPWAIALGAALHVGIALLMSIYAFSIAMLASYVLFLAPDSLLKRLPSRVGTGHFHDKR